MKEINLKYIITQHVNSIDDNIDCTSDVMQRINKRSVKTNLHIGFKRPIVAVLIFCLVSTIAYAATSEILKLKNSAGDEVASIQINESEKNYFLEDHINKHDLYTYKVDEKLKKGAVMVVDTSDHSRFTIHNYPKQYKNYNELTTTTSIQLLPEKLTNFEFSEAYVLQCYKSPTKEERAELAAKNSQQKFYAHPLKKVDAIENIMYIYKKKNSDAEFHVSVSYDSKGDFSRDSSMFDNYKIVNLGTVEAFLSDTKNNVIGYVYDDVTTELEYQDYENNDVTTELEYQDYENDYTLSWYEPKYSFSVNCSPHDYGILDRIYPSDTAESLVQLGTEINKMLNEN